MSGVPMLCGRRTTRTRVDRRFEGAVLEDALVDDPVEGRGCVEGWSLFAITSVAWSVFLEEPKKGVISRMSWSSSVGS